MISKTFYKHKHSTMSVNQAIREGLSSFRRNEPIFARATPHAAGCTTYLMASPIHLKRKITLKPANPALSKAKGATVTLW
ncbi:hypothetical protein KCU83_g24, partial [Aureobasidium melanogenum]